ncbi:Ig-like domain repeat protein [Nocardioides carbamazepini]|uniref:substrate-binding domain-containing protein n=1 Tax=Nocardioides carbamazepini TaxID=2854259 RepID=UPI00214A115E|nr:substrate-binding domain-containing protein [Nocardioides carbamazepini]MCR1781933.1 Ig-like domain repeat protein [Nocardioides carbamazepini]
MSVRKTLTATFAAAVATSAVTMIASPAHAAYNPQPEDSKAAPVAADLIGVGSDTTMIALHQAALVWNGGAKADYGQTFDIATFSALGGGEINLPTNGAKTRPNGSSDGKNKMRTADYSDVDFARSSDAVKTGAEGDELAGIPFALDTVVMAVSNTTPSHAPATLTGAQLKSIYDCTADNWTDVGGTAGPIKAYVPQPGSGTEKFFKAQLVALGLSDYGSCVMDDVEGTPVQEHSDAPVKADANAIVPISKGRAELIPGNTVRLIEGAVAFKRAVYNAVRAGDYAKPEFQAFFGENGFLCSAAAAEAIAAGGLKQLATPANGGVCGTNNDSTTEFATNEVVQSSTALTGTNLAAGVRLSAKVSGSSQPTGSVSFYEGTTLLNPNAAPLVSGEGTYVVPSPTVGVHTYRAVFTPNNAKYLGSEATVTVNYAPPATGPSPALAAAQAQLDKAQAKVAKLKKQVKKATGAKKVKLKKKLKKAKQAVKTATAAVAAAS